MSPTAPHQAIYRRWRAQTFDQIVGQQPVVETLRNAVKSGRSAHAYLFVGPRGTGKTSMARILAKALNCQNLRDGEPCDACPACVAIREGAALDVSEMDAASNNRVDDIRDLMPRIYTAPSDLTRKVFIIDEVQRIREGWDVLLKTLEEPPPHVVFIFCTTDSSQIRPAVLSRIQRFDFRKLTVAEIGGKLRTILEADGRPAEPEAVDLIARLAAGGMRDAESMLDQLLSSGLELTANHVRDVLGLVEEETVEAFARAVVQSDAAAGLELLDRLEERGRDLRAFLEQTVEGLRQALVKALSGERLGLAGAGAAALAVAIRTLASIDPAHAGPGGLRLQLELAVLAAPQPAVAAGMGPALPAPSPAPQPQTATTASVKAEPAERRARAVDGRRQEKRVEPAEPSGPSPAARDEPARPPAAPSPVTGAMPSPQEPPEAPPKPAQVPSEPSGAPTLQQLLERWPEIVAAISRHPPTKPLIEACRPVAIERGIVTLGFPEAKAFLKDVAERRKPILEEGVSGVLGARVAVRCIATNVELVPLPSDPDAERLLTEFRRIYGDDILDVGDVN